MAVTPILPHDEAIQNLNDFSTNLSSSNVGFRDFLNQLGNLSGSFTRLDKSILYNSEALGRGLGDLSHATRLTGSTRGAGSAGGVSNINYNQQQISNVRPYNTPYQPFMPDMGDMFGQGFQHPAMSRNLDRNFRSATPTTMVGQMKQSYTADANKNLLQAGHSLNPLSFMQYSMMFGASFPVQMKMAETITKPVTDVNQQFETIKGFAHGATGFGEAIKGFSGQLKNPFQMYEGIYQSKILLSSALGGEKKSNIAVDNALEMAREYPVKTEQVLSSLSRLAVYPEVKNNLQNTDFQKKLMESVSGLSLIVPEQGMEGAMFSLVEAMSGYWRSMQMRFNVSPEIIEALSGVSKEEMASDPNKLVGGIHAFIGKAVGLDVLEKQKFTFSKQVDNFGDSLQMLTKEVFENTNLYKSVTGAATLFQTGFSALADNKEFIGYVGSILNPYQNRLDSTMAKFAGLGTGVYKSMPMSQVVAAMEKNFEGLTMDEIGERFETLIDDMGGIQRDTSVQINKIMNSKFGDVLGKIGGDIAAVATKSFSGMVTGVLKGIGTTILENPMDVMGPMGAIIAPLMLVLGGVQAIPTLLQIGIEKGHFARMGNKMGNAFFGMSNTQSGAELSAHFQNQLKNSLENPKSGGMGFGLQNAEAQATARFTRVTPNNMNMMLQLHNDELKKTITGTVKIIEGTATNELANEQAGRTSKTGQTIGGRTPKSKVDEMITKATQFENMTVDEQRSINYHRNRLNRMGISDKTIKEMDQSHALKAIREIEDENYRMGKGRQLVDGDEFKLKRQLSTSKYGYNISNFAESQIRATQPRVPNLKELPFEAQDEITENMARRVESKASKYKSIVSDMSPADLRKELAQMPNFRLKSIAADMKEFAPELNITAADLKAGNFNELTEKELKAFAYNIRSASEEVGELANGINRGRFNVHSANQLYSGATFPQTNRLEVLQNAFRASDSLNNYDFKGMLDSKTANRMTRLLNMNADQLRNIEIDIPDVATQRALGTTKINLMQAVNSPEFQQLQRGRMSELITMTPEQAKIGLQGDTALRILDADRNVLSQVTGAMTSGAHRLTGMANLNRFRDAIKGSPLLRGTGAVIGGALNVIDPAFLGYQMYESAQASGMSGGKAAALGVATTGAVGGGMFAYFKNMQNKAYESWLKDTIKTTGKMPEMDDLIKGRAQATNIAKAAFSKSLITPLGMGGIFGVVTGAMEINKERLLSNRELRQREERYAEDIRTTQGLDDNIKNTLIDSNLSFSGDKLTRHNQGMAKMTDNAFIKTLLIGGGIAAMATGLPTLGLLGLAATTMGGGWTGKDYFSGKAQMTEKERGMQTNVSSLAKSTEFYDRKIRSFDEDINMLEFNESIGGLSSEETRKLSTTRKLRQDAVKNKNVQLEAINTMASVYNISDASDNPYFASDYITMRDKKNADDMYDSPETMNNHLRQTTGASLYSYLRSDRNVPEEKRVSEYLALATLDTQSKSELDTKMTDAIAKDDRTKINEILKLDSLNNERMYEKFVGAAATVDFEDPNQSETVRQAEVARISAIVVPRGDKEGMREFRKLNQGSLIQQVVSSQILGATSINRNERDLYSSIEQAAGSKLAGIGIVDPLKILSQTREEYLTDRGASPTDDSFKNLDSGIRGKLEAAGFTSIDQLKGDDVMGSGLSAEQYLTRVGKMRENKLSGNEAKEVQSAIEKSDDYVDMEKDYDKVRVDAIKGMRESVTGKSGFGTITKLEQEQELYKNADLSKYSENERENITRQINRRSGTIEQIKQAGGAELGKLVSDRFGEDASFESLSDKQITDLVSSDEFKESGVAKKLETSLDSLNGSTLAIQKTFDTTKEATEKVFNNALERAGTAVNLFAEGFTSAGDFNKEGAGFIETIKNSINALETTGNTRKELQEQKFSELVQADPSIRQTLSDAGIKSVKDLTEIDASGTTGLTKLSKTGTIDDQTFSKLQTMAGSYSEGEKQVMEASGFRIAASDQMAKLAFQASASGDEDLPFAWGMAGLDRESKKKLKSTMKEEVIFAAERVESASTPEEKKLAEDNFKNIYQNATQYMSPRQLRAAMGADRYKRISSGFTEGVVEKENNDAYVSMVTGGVRMPQIPDDQKELLRKEIKSPSERLQIRLGEKPLPLVDQGSASYKDGNMVWDMKGGERGDGEQIKNPNQEDIIRIQKQNADYQTQFGGKLPEQTNPPIGAEIGKDVVKQDEISAIVTDPKTGERRVVSIGKEDGGQEERSATIIDKKTEEMKRISAGKGEFTPPPFISGQGVPSAIVTDQETGKRTLTTLGQVDKELPSVDVESKPLIDPRVQKMENLFQGREDTQIDKTEPPPSAMLSGGAMIKPQIGNMPDNIEGIEKPTIEAIIKPDTSQLQNIPSVEIGASIKPSETGDNLQLDNSVQSTRSEINLNPESGRMFNADGSAFSRPEALPDYKNSIFAGNQVNLSQDEIGSTIPKIESIDRAANAINTLTKQTTSPVSRNVQQSFNEITGANISNEASQRVTSSPIYSDNYFSKDDGASTALNSIGQSSFNAALEGLQNKSVKIQTRLDDPSLKID